MACGKFFRRIFCCIVPDAGNDRDDDVDDFYDVNREPQNLQNNIDQPALDEPENVDNTKGYPTVTDEEKTGFGTENQKYENQKESDEISENMDDIDEEPKGEKLDEESLDPELSVCSTVLQMDDLKNVEENEKFPDEPVTQDSEDSASLDTFDSDGTDLDLELEELEEDLVEIKFEGEIPSSSPSESETASQLSCSIDEQMSRSSPKCQDTLSDGEKSEHAGNSENAGKELLDPPKNRKTVRFDYMVKCKAGNSVLRLPLCLPSKVFCTDDEESDEDEVETSDDHTVTSQLASKASESQDSPGPSSASRLRSRLGQLSLQYSDSSEVTADFSNVRQSPLSTSSQSPIAGSSFITSMENSLGESSCPRVSVSSRFRSSMAELSAEYSTSEESLNPENSFINSSPDVNSTTSSDSGTETPTIDANLSSCPSPATSSTSNADSGYDENSPPDESRNRLRGRLRQLGERFANYE